MTSTISRSGYKGFGSFHSDDVEVLIRQDAASYIPPVVPFSDPLEDQSSCCKCFGDAAKQHFLIDFEQWTFVNHGAFGGVSQPAYKCADLWRRHCELQPLRFIDRELFPHLVRVIRDLAAFVNCRPQDIVLLPNATTGLNAVIGSCKLQPGNVVYSLDIGYGSVKKMLQAACDASGAQHVEGQVTFPISGPEDVMAVVEQTMPDGTKLAMFDAVTSNTALVLPIQELVVLCKRRGIPVLIDGAHALGMLPIDLQQLQPDFFVSNCHKWLCGARGSAMLYADPQWQQHLRPPVLSHGAHTGFLSRFIWDGCRDYAPLLAISTAVRWWKGLGGAPASVAAENCSPDEDNWAQFTGSDPSGTAAPGAAAAAVACCDSGNPAHAGDGGSAARVYMYGLLRAAAAMLVQRWGTGCLGPASMTAAMVLVQLPTGGMVPQPGSATSADAKYIQDVLHLQYRIEVPIKNIEDTLYVRISTHIYNSMQDYLRLAAAVEATLLGS